MSSNIEQGTKTLGQALGLAAQPVTPGFPAKDQQEESKGVTGAYAGPLRVEGGSKQLGGTASKIESLVRDINGSNPAAQPQTPVTITVTLGVSPTTPSVGPAVQSPSVGSHNPLINPMMPSRDPLAGPTAPVVGSGKQPGGLIGAIRQLTHAPVTKEPRYTTITGAPTDNPVARSVNSASKRQLADVSGIEDAGQSSAEKGLSV